VEGVTCTKKKFQGTIEKGENLLKGENFRLAFEGKKTLAGEEGRKKAQGGKKHWDADNRSLPRRGKLH